LLFLETFTSPRAAGTTEEVSNLIFLEHDWKGISNPKNNNPVSTFLSVELIKFVFIVLVLIFATGDSA
jgi:hypothetical protein